MSDLQLLTTTPASARLRAGLAATGRQHHALAASWPTGRVAEPTTIELMTKGCEGNRVDGRFPNPRPTPGSLGDVT